MSKEEFIQGFSKYLFWDVKREDLDPEQNVPYIVQRVLEYGQITDWQRLLGYYGMDKVVGVAKQLRSLESRALSFISTVSKTPVNQFRCYTLRHLIPAHCDF